MSVKVLFGSMLLAVVAVIGLVVPLSVQAASAPGAPVSAALPATGSTLDVSARPPEYALTLAQDVTTTITNTITTTVPVTGPAKIANAISSYFSVTVASEIMSMHASGMGFGEIFRLFQLAALSGTTTEEIRSMRESGEGWGEIAHELGVPPGNKGTNLGAAVSGRTENGNGKGASEVKPKGNQEPAPSGNPNNNKGNGGGKPQSPGGGNGKGNGNK